MHRYPNQLASAAANNCGEIRNLRWRGHLAQTFRWIRHCCVCGKISPPIDLLCTSCEVDVGRLVNSPLDLRQRDYPFAVYSLFTWTRENDYLLRPVLYSLKGGYAPQILGRWLRLLSSHRIQAAAVPYRPSFILPPRAPSIFGVRARDHGWLINQRLAADWRADIYDGLIHRHASCGAGIISQRWSERMRHNAQKRKTRGERFSQRFEARGDLKDFHGLRTSVFADDVITTGATALAAYMALGDPPSFEVWTLACRSKLARPARV